MEKVENYRQGQSREWHLTFMPGSDGSKPSDEWKSWKRTRSQRNNVKQCTEIDHTTVTQNGTPLCRNRSHFKTFKNRREQIQ